MNSRTLRAYPSVGTIARALSLCDNAVRKGLKALHRNGHLDIIRGGGRRGSNLYRWQLSEQDHGSSESQLASVAPQGRAVAPSLPLQHNPSSELLIGLEQSQTSSMPTRSLAAGRRQLASRMPIEDYGREKREQELASWIDRLGMRGWETLLAMDPDEVTKLTKLMRTRKLTEADFLDIHSKLSAPPDPSRRRPFAL